MKKLVTFWKNTPPVVKAAWGFVLAIALMIVGVDLWRRPPVAASSRPHEVSRETSPASRDRESYSTRAEAFGTLERELDDLQASLASVKDRVASLRSENESLRRENLELSEKLEQFQARQPEVTVFTIRGCQPCAVLIKQLEQAQSRVRFEARLIYEDDESAEDEAAIYREVATKGIRFPILLGRGYDLRQKEFNDRTATVGYPLVWIKAADGGTRRIDSFSRPATAEDWVRELRRDGARQLAQDR